MPTMAEVRQKYPQYSDMSDQQLAGALHKKYYADMPEADFAAKIGLKPAEAPAKQNAAADFLGPRTMAAETLAKFASGAAASIPAGLAGIAGTVLPGEQGQGARWVEKIQNAMTYQPRTQAGQQMSDMAAVPFEKLAQAGDIVGEYPAEAGAALGFPKTGAAVGAAVNTAVQSAPALLLRGRNGRSSPSGVDSPAWNRPVQSTAETAPKAGREAGLAGVSEKPPTIDELRTLKTDAYKRADESGITIADSSIKGLKTRIVADLKKGGLNPTLHPDTTAALQQVLKSKGDMSLTDLETLRKVASDAEGSIKPADRLLAGKVVDHIDNLMENLTDKDVVAGSPEQALALKEARGYYSRLKKSETISELFRRAELSAPNFSGSGMENALRTEFRSLAKNDRRMRRFNAEERAAIEKVAKGGSVENILRQIGKLAPTGVVSAGTGAMAGAFIGGPVGAAAVPIAGIASRAAATRMTMKNAAAAEELMRRGPKNALAKPKPRNALATTP